MLYCTYCSAACISIAASTSFQCDNCFYTEDPIRVFDIDGECPVCLDEADSDGILREKRVFPCGHWLCAKCEIMSRVKAPYDQPLICPLCQAKSITGRELDGCYQKDPGLDRMIKPEFAKLFLLLDRPAVNIHAYPPLPPVNHIVEHAKLLVLLNEYYRWLLLLAQYGNCMEPSDAIKELWQKHILDTKSYRTVCRIILKRDELIDHDPVCTDDRFKRFDITLQNYTKKYGQMTEAAEVNWRVLGYYHYHHQKRSVGQIFIQEVTGRIYGIPFYNEMTILDMKQLIRENRDIALGKQRIIFDGKQLDDERTASDYQLKIDDKCHLVMRLSGC